VETNHKLFCSMFYSKRIELETKRQFEIIDITSQVVSSLKSVKIRNGQVNVYSPHTTASIRLNHFEPLLLQDLMKVMYKLAPLDASYAHDFFEIRTEISAAERSNGHAHVKAFLLGSSETVPVVEGKMQLGHRQNIFFVEFDGGRRREYIISIFGE